MRKPLGECSVVTGGDRSVNHRKLKRRSIVTIFASALLSTSLAADVFINEFHYDNAGSDTGEGFEIAGDAGTDLNGWSVVFYNGSNGTVYRTTSLSGVIPNQQNGFGTLAFNLPSNGMQNGSPDGLALVNSVGTVLQFISYEGALTANGGPADGQTSIDIGVSESSGTPVGFSLQLSGEGDKKDDFTWNAPAVNSFGAVNSGQVFGQGGVVVDSAPSILASTPADKNGAVGLDANIEVQFSEAVVVDNSGVSLSCSVSGNHSFTSSVSGQLLLINPDVDFVFDEICTVAIAANAVSDLDNNDPPDNLENDFSIQFSTRIDSPIVINEVDADTAGSDTLEFIELYDGGIGNTALDGLVVVLYNGSDDRSTGVVFDLDGQKTNSEGYFVLGNAALVPAANIVIANNSIQNGADAVAIHKGDASDYPNDTPVSGLRLVDAVVYDTFDSDDAGLIDVLTPNQPQINEGDAGNKDDHSIARIPDGGLPIDTSTYIAQIPTPGKSNVKEVEIFEIQGTGMSSPFEGSYVRTRSNVVTAVDSNGFFMQTPSERSDFDSQSSDGIFVFTGAAPSVVAGDLVDVQGNVIEYFGFTEFSGGARVTIIGSGNPLPPVVLFDENTPSPNQPQAETELERFEGMLVSFNGVATSATDRFGDTAVVASQTRAFREVGIEYPGISGLPVWDGNPEIFELDPNALGGQNISLYAGQSVTATGPLGFSFGDYQVWPIELQVGETPHLLTPVRKRTEGEMTVAALNMFRLFDTVNDPGVSDPRVSETEYARRLNKMAMYVVEVMGSPDILAVSEVENLNVLNDLAAQINSLDSQVQYSVYLESGNDVGGINVGFMTRRSVEVDSVTQYGKETVFDFDGSLLNDRPPLLISARNVADGSDFAINVLVIHNRSLSRVDSSERVRQKRLAQAQFVADIVQELQTNDPSINLVVTGDFNAYQFTDGYVDVLGQITGWSVESDNLLWAPSPVNPTLINQVESLPMSQRYSYVFGGSAQVLDHTLTSMNLDNMVTDFVFSRGNADVPASLINDESTALRVSDHDGQVLYILKDSDNDSVADNLDVCPNTSIPETMPSKGLKPNHFAFIDNDGVFDTVKNNRLISIDETAGCSCEQIVAQMGLGKGHLKHGCSQGTMNTWIAQQN